MTALAYNDELAEPFAASDDEPVVEAEGVSEADADDLDLDYEATLKDAQGLILEPLKTAEPLTRAEELALGRKKQLYADLRTRAIVSENDPQPFGAYGGPVKAMSKRFDKTLYWALVEELPYEERRQIPASEDAFWQMYRANLRLVWAIAKSFYRGNPNEDRFREDRFQDGCVGLIRAVELFDPELGFKFSTYASRWIKQAVMANMKQQRTIVLPADIEPRVAKFLRTKEELTHELGQTPSLEQLADALGITAAEAAAIERIPFTSTSLNMTISAERGELGDFIADDVDLIPEIAVLRELEQGTYMALLKELPTTQRKVLAMRLGLAPFDGDRQWELKAIAGKLGTTPERVRDLERQALEQVRILAAEQGLV